ncbi:MAG TPA: hypothetical protein ENH55_05695 [Aurantimonas coralicida]|uniref:Uncharacterized protein n=2 Tax=root TaxID=1 RepID=A0A9C9NGH4_9HYPH|nr:hypothetical protein [Aurantimonas coralicida]HEU01266.1 hypothetical protein [Aurantimonas coralicida]
MTVFAGCLGHLGLTAVEAAALLGCSPATVRAKMKGARQMTRDDAAAMIPLFRRILTGDVADEPAGVRDAAAALRILRGVEVVPERRPGPKPK